MRHRCPSALLHGLLAAFVVSLLPPVATALEPEAIGVDASLGPRVADIVTDAARLLDTRPCSLLLSDFVDARSGRTLAENLAATGRTASEHVRSLLFRGAPSLKPFPGRRVFAYTTPSSPIVLLCREDFLRVRNQRRLATAIVIHEVLHTLGLRGDHPSSVAITERVLERCS